MRSVRNSLSSLEIPNMASTAVKTNINNIRDHQNDRRKNDFTSTHKKYTFCCEVFSFTALLFRFTLLKLCEMHSKIIVIHYFERKRIVSERHVFAKCEHGHKFQNLSILITRKQTPSAFDHEQI